MDIAAKIKLVCNLAYNDFKRRFAGSYLGVVWAIVQPVVTVCMYWLVFDVIMHGAGAALRGGDDVPFVLFLTSGIVPWFYFSDAVTGGTAALTDYSYLVKKVVFNVKLLPPVKVVSATFTHIAFMLIAIVIAWASGYAPTAYTVQVLYYSLCTFTISLGLAYLLSALQAFVRDIAQIVSILLQVGIWATPVMWNLAAVSKKLASVMRFNPLAYVCNGYRGALYMHVPFWSDVFGTVYFWSFTVVVWLAGIVVFRKLRPQLADVL